jgi:hypothetical protein
LSAIGAVTLSSQRQRINTYWQFYSGNIVATDVGENARVVLFFAHDRRTQDVGSAALGGVGGAGMGGMGGGGFGGAVHTFGGMH